ncbi:flagellar assembly protein FliX [Phenylobacterium sp.]|jgi:hypothetical protein|uniref:flagellar assembly regulator FliX n=1 Tax=Phenylobacterium sp. TaxID=1871053 RepID=UPI002F952757
MKVIGPNGIGQTQGPRQARPSGAGGFRLPGAADAAGPSQAASVSGMSSVMGMDALLALQDVGGPLERKRRAVSRAGRILDELEKLKVALLDGEVTNLDMQRLQRAVREARDQTDDPRLEAVLEEVEMRAAVELAKLEVATRAA